MFSGALAASTGPASAAQQTDRIHFDVLDYGKDVNHGYTINRSDLHDELDILEVSSALQGPDVAFEMRVRGSIVGDNTSYHYSWSVCYDPVDWTQPPTCGSLFAPANITVSFSNGSATSRELYGTPVNVTVGSFAGPTLRVMVPFALFANFSDSWFLTGSASYSGNGSWFDEANLDATGGALFPYDITTDTTNYTSPAVNITSVLVEGQGSLFRVTVNGTSSGNVGELRVALGQRSDLAGVTVWTWRGWWREQDAPGLDPNATLAKVGATWAAWQFQLEFDPSIYAYGLVTLTELEVRAIASDGAWGHVNQTCACGTSTGPIPAQGGGGNNTNGSNGTGTNTTGGLNNASTNQTPGSPAKGFLPGLGAPAAVAAMASAAVSAWAVRRGQKSS